MMRPRSDADIRLQGPLNALRAARTASSMSAASPSATSASFISVAGSRTVKTLPDFACTHLPSISIGRGLESHSRRAFGTRSIVGEMEVWMFIMSSALSRLSPRSF